MKIVKDQSLNPSSITSSSDGLNKRVLDNLDTLEYDSPISEGEAMVPKALEYAKNKAEIHITGGNARKRNFVKKAARWMLGYSLGNRLANNIQLKISLREDLRDTRFYGSVIWEDDNQRPREYDMELCNYLRDRMLYRVLAHEVSHIRQYAIGDLKDLATHANFCKWKNEMILSEGYGSGSYFNLPWEIEARKEQEVILSAWKKAHGYHFRQKTGELYNDNL
jgi:hypothetical protein